MTHTKERNGSECRQCVYLAPFIIKGKDGEKDCEAFVCFHPASKGKWIKDIEICPITKQKRVY